MITATGLDACGPIRQGMMINACHHRAAIDFSPPVMVKRVQMVLVRRPILASIRM
ncbi:MAG: hypothetical protein JSS76_17370 [Bacteroidetes bacterium]|nr:hypothetical protein [Bacteroidota bacterium]